MRIRNSQGFTLIEILIAIVVISLALTSVFGVFSSVSATKERLEREGSEHHLARVLLDRIGRELRGVYFSSKNPQTRFVAADIDGQPTLEFTTTTDTPYGDTRAGLAVVRYRLEKTGSENGLALLRGERQLFAEDSSFAREHRLTDKVRKLQFRYYEGGAWQSVWTAGTKSLPKLVEVTLTLGTAEKESIFRTSFELRI